MNTTLRWCLRLALLVSVGLLPALFFGVGRRAGGAALRFEPNPLVISEVMQSGKEYDFEAVVVNAASHPARLIGVYDYCSVSCYSGRGIPTVIPPGGRGRAIVHVRAGSPGDLIGELTFYTDQPSQPTLAIKLAGTVREDEPHDAPMHAANP